MQNNIEEYIESGILELYATDTLPPAEAAEVARMAAQHPEIATEIAAIETALSHFALQHAVAPPPTVEAALRAKLLGKPATMTAVPPATPATMTAVPPVSAVPTAMPTQRGYLKYAAAILAFSLGLNGYFYYQWQNATAQIADMETKNTLFTERYQSQKASFEMTKGLLADVSFSKVRTVQLAGIPATAPTANALVYWRESDGKVLFNPTALPPPPPNQQYQLWAIIDGKPVDAGMVALDAAVELQPMKDIKGGAVAFAVTLEKVGGNPSPTMSAMYVMGKV